MIITYGEKFCDFRWSKNLDTSDGMPPEKLEEFKGLKVNQ